MRAAQCAALPTRKGVTVSEIVSFDNDPVGSVPASWIAGVTGQGASQWTVEREPSAPSPPNVLKQGGTGDFPWCVRRGVAIADGYVEVKFMAVSGRRDQAGGLVWRWKDGDNYYVARANALENNVSLYYTQNGRRITIQYVDAPVARKRWHTLRAEFTGQQMRVALNGTFYIEIDDGHIAGAGAIGVWTKADSVTLFDDLRFGTAPAR
jgi:hypothetical protein